MWLSYLVFGVLVVWAMMYGEHEKVTPTNPWCAWYVLFTISCWPYVVLRLAALGR